MGQFDRYVDPDMYVNSAGELVAVPGLLEEFSQGAGKGNPNHSVKDGRFCSPNGGDCSLNVSGYKDKAQIEVRAKPDGSGWGVYHDVYGYLGDVERGARRGNRGSKAASKIRSSLNSVTQHVMDAGYLSNESTGEDRVTAFHQIAKKRMGVLLDEAGVPVPKLDQKQISANRTRLETEKSIPDAGTLDYTQASPDFDPKTPEAERSATLIRKMFGARVEGGAAWVDRPALAEHFGAKAEDVKWTPNSVGELVPRMPDAVGKRIAEATGTNYLVRDLAINKDDRLAKPDNLFEYLRGKGMYSKSQLPEDVVLPPGNIQTPAGGDDSVFTRPADILVPKPLRVIMKADKMLTRLDTFTASGNSAGMTNPGWKLGARPEEFSPAPGDNAAAAKVKNDQWQSIRTRATKAHNRYNEQDTIFNLMDRAPIKPDSLLVGREETMFRRRIDWDEVDNVYVNDVTYSELVKRFHALPEKQRVIGSRKWSDVVKITGDPTPGRKFVKTQNGADFYGLPIGAEIEPKTKAN